MPDPYADLLDALETALPAKRQVNIDSWPRPVWLWRLELSQALALNAKRKLLDDSERGLQEFFLELLGYSLGDENAPGAFATARGRDWLRRQPTALLELGRLAREFNELAGPSDERKKKSETPPDSAPSTTCAETSATSTLDD